MKNIVHFSFMGIIFVMGVLAFKGTSGNFGFLDVSVLAGKMEFQVVSKNKEELLKLFFQLKEYGQQMLLGLENNK